MSHKQIPSRNVWIYRLFNTLSVLTFLNLLFGPLVRATGSGLACPDWPLCFGQVFPAYNFQIAMEVGHRYVAMILGIVLLILIIGILVDSFLRSRLGKLMLLTIILLAIQVNLGRLTVTKWLDPAMVNMHLVNAILFFAAIITMTFFSGLIAKGKDPRQALHWSQLWTKQNVLAVLATLAVLLQIILGARVSSNYAGLACPDFPTCNGEWFPIWQGQIRYQMEHRIGAYVIALLILVAFWKAWKKKEAGLRETLISVFLVAFQIFLGVVNVYHQLPKLITALHTGTAVLIFITMYLGLLERIREKREVGA